MTDSKTGAELLVDALRAAGIRYLFANFGSDHPAIIEALAADRERGVDTPAVITCPHEFSALSAAHGYALVTGEPAAVFVHTDVGTANLGGAVHNAARSRVPVFIFAGLTPYTLEGELPGGRTTLVNHRQDAPDQHAIVRQYVKWNYDIRTGRNVPQLVNRALQIATSAPPGPVYLTGAREVLAESVPVPSSSPQGFPPVTAIPAPTDLVRQLLRDIDAARLPVLVTGYLGRHPSSVPKLVDLAERLGVAIVESAPERMNFPATHPLHAGDDPHALLTDADLVLAVDTDAPWLPSAGSPRPDATVWIVGDDPLQQTIPLWTYPATHLVRADSGVLLDQLLEALEEVAIDAGRADARRAAVRTIHDAQRAAWAGEVEMDVAAGRLTAASVAATLARVIDDDTIVVNEAISQASIVGKHLPRSMPGTMFANGGTSLGFSGAGSLGVKLAADEAAEGAGVVSIIGDGSFFFSVPSSTFWIAERYGLPTLTVVLDNGGWNATKINVTRPYGDGAAVQGDRLWVNLRQSADLPGIAAAAGDAWGETVDQLDRLDAALREALAHVAAGRPAVISVRLEPISQQAADGLFRRGEQATPS